MNDRSVDNAAVWFAIYKNVFTYKDERASAQ